MMDVDSAKFLRRTVYGVVFGMVVYLAIAFFGDMEAMVDIIGRVPVMVVVGACGLSAVNYLLRFAKWHFYLRLLDIDIGVRHSLLVFLAGLIMAISPGKLGEVIKSALLKRSHGLSIARTAPVVLAERLTDLLGLFALAAVGIIVFQYGIIGFGAMLVLLLIFVAVVQSPELVNRGLDLVEQLPLVGKYRSDLDRAYGSTRTLLQWRPLAATTLLSAAAWSMEAIAFGWILSHLGVDLPVLFEAVFVFSTSTLLGAVSFLPGGLGLTEGSMAGLLIWLDVFDSFDPAMAATYLIRLTTLWFGVAVGLVAFLLYEWRQRLQSRPEETATSES